MFEKCGEDDRAVYYLNQALDSYTEIEAHGKVDQMTKVYNSLRPKLDISVLEATVGKFQEKPVTGTITTDLVSVETSIAP